MNACHPRIKVCHLASGDLWAGAEVQVVNVCRGLLDMGVVEVAAIVLNGGRLADELQSLGVEVTLIDEQTSAWWKILRKIVRRLVTRPVEVLHTHRYKENILGAMAAKMSGIPRVVRTVHGTREPYTGWRWVKIKTYGALDDLISRYYVDAIIGVSGEITGDLGRRFPGKRIMHIPNCIDERCLVITRGREEKRAELGLKPSEFVIGTVGRLTPVKGTEYVIRAVPELVRRRNDVRVVVVGDGPLRADLEGLACSLGLEGTVRFLGWRDDRIDIMNALDLLVLPSLHEGMPTVLLEAMSLGVPVVASASGGIPEILTDGWNGFLATPGSESSLARKCLHIMSDQSLANRLTANGRQEIRRYHLRETMVPLLSLYRGLRDFTTPHAREGATLPLNIGDGARDPSNP